MDIKNLTFSSLRTAYRGELPRLKKAWALRPPAVRRCCQILPLLLCLVGGGAFVKTGLLDATCDWLKQATAVAIHHRETIGLHENHPGRAPGPYWVVAVCDSFTPEIAFGAVGGDDFLRAGLNPNYSHHLNASGARTAIEELRSAFGKATAAGTGIGAISVLSHANLGFVQINGDELSDDFFDLISRDLRGPRQVLLGGCNIAKNKGGKNFIHLLAEKYALTIIASESVNYVWRGDEDRTFINLGGMAMRKNDVWEALPSGAVQKKFPTTL